MRDEGWIKTVEDGRNVKFIYQALPEGGAFITAQLAGSEVVYSIVLSKARNPLSLIANQNCGVLREGLGGGPDNDPGQRNLYCQYCPLAS
jgi:hypothetical protein